MDRRDFIKTSIVTAAAAAATRAASATEAPAYPRKRLAKLSELKVGEARLLQYPDERSPVFLMALEAKAEGGVGPKENIVAYSALCTHRGCQVQHSGARLLCTCHFSAFDPAKSGECYQGVATEYLPRITLLVEGEDILATGVEGLIWGRRDNR